MQMARLDLLSVLSISLAYNFLKLSIILNLSLNSLFLHFSDGYVRLLSVQCPYYFIFLFFKFDLCGFSI